MGDAAGTFEDIVVLKSGHELILEALRALAYGLHAEAVEVARPGDRAVSWGWGARKMTEAYACPLPYRAHVNLGFYRGTYLPHPANRLKGARARQRGPSALYRFREGLTQGFSPDESADS